MKFLVCNQISSTGFCSGAFGALFRQFLVQTSLLSMVSGINLSQPTSCSVNLSISPGQTSKSKVNLLVIYKEVLIVD